MFCGTHDLSMRGKEHEGILKDLIKLKIEAGDRMLTEHIEKYTKNATYIFTTDLKCNNRPMWRCH